MNILIPLFLVFLQAPSQPTANDADTAANSTATVGDSAATDGEQDANAENGSAEQAATDGDAGAGDQESNRSAPDSFDAEPPLWRVELERFLNTGAIRLFRKGGIFMWPILILGIVAAGVVIERFRSLRMLSTDTGSLRENTRKLLQEDRVEEALRLCHEEQGPVPAILSSGLRKYLVLRRLNYDPGRIEEQVVKSMDDYGIHVVAALERHLAVLATVSSAAPMLGFLGTVSGMIVSFDEIVAKMGETNIVLAAAGGISVALLTTCFGLIVGIPSYVAYNYFTSLINRFVLDVEESATELIEAVTLQIALDKGAAGGPAPEKLDSEKPALEKSRPSEAKVEGA